MRNTILSIMFIGGLFGGASLPEQAFEKLEAGDYMEAVALYDSTLAHPDYYDEHRAVHFNIGQALIQSDSFDLAQASYSKCTQLSPKERGYVAEREVASFAWNNIGITRIKRGAAAQQNGGGQMSIGGNNMPNMGQPQGGDASKEIFDEALKAFKEALKMDPENEFARFNYELLMHRIQQAENQQKEEDQDNQSEDKNQNEEDQKEDQEKDQDKENQNKEDEGKPDKNKQDNPEENKEKKGQNQQNQGESDQQMSEQQAKQLLEAMNEKEKQFIQQLEKRAKKKGRKKRNDGPDW